MNWLNSEAFILFDQHILWSDMIGNILGLVALALGWRRSIWSWPVQFLSGLVLFGAFSATSPAAPASRSSSWSSPLYGWWQWNRSRGRPRGRPHHPAVRHLARARAPWSAPPPSARSPSALLFKAYPTLSWDPWPDAYIFVGTIVAMYAQARGMVEFWFAWLLVDLVGVPLNFANGYAFSGFVYVIYGALVLWGMRDWWLRSRKDARPVLEGAPA